MKFDKFIKSVGSKGLIFKDHAEKWLYCNGVMMNIDNKTCIGNIVDIPNYINLDEFIFCEAKLSEAILPYADAKAKDIIRIFKDDCGDEIGISQANFALIETSDFIEIMTDDIDKVVGLSISEGYGEKAEIKGIIFNTEWLNEQIKFQEENNNGN